MRVCNHPNIIKLVEIYTIPDQRRFQDLWYDPAFSSRRNFQFFHDFTVTNVYVCRVVMEYGGYDLGKFLKLAPTLAGWSEHHVRFISWQIIAALNYLHSANIAHRVCLSESECT